MSGFNIRLKIAVFLNTGDIGIEFSGRRDAFGHLIYDVKYVNAEGGN